MIKNAGIFEEISDQYVPEANAAGQGWGTLVSRFGASSCTYLRWAMTPMKMQILVSAVRM
ncbi:hypothetical protein CUROG_08755 [Corynebacterium urogenitale]|uniref:Uncharacterized protein n=1 Tax=Corynebacterium urogenitale TaxID=2487892 RepID=A0A5J6ZCD9_9CORY|nr:hypothetical protein [Corynebacterium urogenitale]QFQ03099.1 hypothetical protein CUROG_08755 [Corynebacterium urogenitale]